jgi:flavin reductase (DIM6/NTAB) family NADH-FMN oxidoreductase RutF
MAERNETDGVSPGAVSRAAGVGTHPHTAFEQAEFRATVGHFASGVVIVTGAGPDGPAGLTCQSFFSLSLEPPMIAVAPGLSSASWPAIAESGAFCINILRADQEALCRDFARSGHDKFAGLGWTPAASGSPRLDGVLAWLDCRIETVTRAGDHWLALGLVLELGVDQGDPLLFYRGGFGTFHQ